MQLVFTPEQIYDQTSEYNRLAPLLRSKIMTAYQQHCYPTLMIFEVQELANKLGFPTFTLVIKDVQGDFEWFRRYVLFELASRSL